MTTTKTCPRCGGPNGAHGLVHVRHGNGGGHNELCPAAGTRPTVPDRPYRLRTVAGSRIRYVVRVDDRAVGHLWRTSRADRRAPWAYRLRLRVGVQVLDLQGEAVSRAAAQDELTSVIRSAQAAAKNSVPPPSADVTPRGTIVP